MKSKQADRQSNSSGRVFSFDDPFRPIYEYYAIGAWLAAAGLMVVMQAQTQTISVLFSTMAVFSLMMASYRGWDVVGMHATQKRLEGRALTFMTRADVKKAVKGNEDCLFLGYGFEWTGRDAQMVHNIRRSDPAKIAPQNHGDMGQKWIHGIGLDRERPLHLPIEHSAGHMLLVGTTQAGKTRFLDNLIIQAVNRGEPVIVFDPKGDRGLSDSLEAALKRVGRPNDYVYMHPAFPEKCWRIDPLKNFNRVTELASRVAGIIPSETGNDPFISHAQMLLTNLCGAMLMINMKPTLVNLKRFVDTGPEWLVVRACEKHFEDNVHEWRERLRPYMKSENKGGKNDRTLATVYDNFYNSVVKDEAHDPTIEGLLADFNHDKSHQQKMIASLMPVLTMLTSGSLSELLSPSSGDLDDQRPITDLGRIIRNRQGAYLGLDSLSDNMVGAALGSMFISDLTAVSGARYNFETEDGANPPPVNVIIDEAAELVSDKLIQLLNKAGGSNMRIILATQTFADFVARVGSDAKARQILGNLNIKIVLRTIDGDTQEYVAESLPKTWVRHIEYSQATDAGTDDPLEFGYRISESMKEVEVPMIPPDLLGCLPNLEFFAQISAGKIIKGRIPIVKDDE